MRDTELRIDVASEFSPIPGARFEDDGPWSGEEFRKVHLEPLFRDTTDERCVIVILDGAAGFATSFLEEAFGGLARKFTPKRCLARIKIISDEDPLLADEVYGYMKEARAEG